MSGEKGKIKKEKKICVVGDGHLFNECHMPIVEPDLERERERGRRECVRRERDRG
jgi:hypothetical protein